ncbi:MAG: nucleoside hydrolase [bacterium]
MSRLNSGKRFHRVAFMACFVVLASALSPRLVPAQADKTASAEEGTANKRLIIIDDDLGMLRSAVKKAGAYQYPWIPITDPDGGLELIYALRDPEVKVLGVTCSMGCSATEVCMKSANRILDLTGRTDVPVLEGARSPDELGKPTEASRFIINTVLSHPGEVEIVATAPLTNIATALMHEPCLKKNWKKLHVGSGEFMGELSERSDAYYARFTGYKDLNLNVDPPAARYVLEYVDNFKLYPNEIMDDASLTLADRRKLKKADSRLAEWVAREINVALWLGATFGKLAGYEGLYLHGVIPLAVAIEPGLAEPPQMMRFKMTERKWGGYTFTLTDDPSVPERPVYVRLKNPEAIEKRVVARCR